MKIVIDSAIPYIRGVFEPYAEVHYIAGTEIDRSNTADANALIIRTRTTCDQSLLQGSRVEIISSATIGYDHIDMEYCNRMGIKVTTAQGSNARGVLQWVSGVLAALAEKQKWAPHQKIIGIVGVGNTGSLVAKYCATWGFRVLCCDPPRERRGEKDPNGKSYISREALLEQAEIITLHIPLNRDGKDRTLHMGSVDFFARMKPNSTLLNCSRGEIVETDKLINAIRTKRLCAAIDTWEGEPHLDLTLLNLSTLATPHIAGYSIQGKANATAMVVDAVARQLGLPINGWYPEGVNRQSEILKKGVISWKQMTSQIATYFDPVSETELLKQNPEKFEALRNNYNYREEFF